MKEFKAKALAHLKPVLDTIASETGFDEASELANAFNIKHIVNEEGLVDLYHYQRKEEITGTTTKEDFIYSVVEYSLLKDWVI